jgi:PhnB protein
MTLKGETSMTIQPYLFFDGRCEEAIDFYRRTIDAKVTHVMRFKDVPNACSPGQQHGDKVMHAAIEVGGATVLASDGECHGKPNFNGFGLSLNAPSDSEAERLFGALSDGGAVQMPLTQTFFASKFGMVKDRFGVTWMVVAGSA